MFDTVTLTIYQFYFEIFSLFFMENTTVLNDTIYVTNQFYFNHFIPIIFIIMRINLIFPIRMNFNGINKKERKKNVAIYKTVFVRLAHFEDTQIFGGSEKQLMHCTYLVIEIFPFSHCIFGNF